MKVENLKQLQKLIALCRKAGVDAIEVDGIKIAMGAAPRPKPNVLAPETDFPEAGIKIPQYNPVVKTDVSALVADTIKTDGLTPDELLFYSASGQLEEKTSN